MKKFIKHGPGAFLTLSVMFLAISLFQENIDLASDYFFTQRVKSLWIGLLEGVFFTAVCIKNKRVDALLVGVSSLVAFASYLWIPQGTLSTVIFVYFILTLITKWYYFQRNGG